MLSIFHIYDIHSIVFEALAAKNIPNFKTPRYNQNDNPVECIQKENLPRIRLMLRLNNKYSNGKLAHIQI